MYMLVRVTIIIQSTDKYHKRLIVSPEYRAWNIMQPHRHTTETNSYG